MKTKVLEEMDIALIQISLTKSAQMKNLALPKEIAMTSREIGVATSRYQHHSSNQ
jgi:hypothetical protein